MNFKKAMLLGLLSINSPAAMAATVPADSAARTPNLEPIDWQPCPTDTHADLVCAKYPVPLHYRKTGYGNLDMTDSDNADQTDTRIYINLSKLPAQNPAKPKLGSLFFNFGGPGGPGADTIRMVGDVLLNKGVLDQYDYIGFDPRGVGGSQALTCGITFNDPESNPGPPPVTAQQVAARFALNKSIQSKCAANGGKILDHMSTADVARDLDVLRRAVGDKQLNYVGLSYGSYLGVTYANLYPQNVGRLLVDGVLDPVKWSTGKGADSRSIPITTRLGSDKSSMATLKEFFRLCELAGNAGCKFAGNSEARYDAMLKRLDQSPVEVVFPDGQKGLIDSNFVASVSIGALENSPYWNLFAEFIESLEKKSSPSEISKKLWQYKTEMGYTDQPAEDNGQVSFAAVLCTDSDNPSDPRYWPIAAEKAQRKSYFGRIWTWDSSVCLNWPGSKKGRYMGPFDNWTKNPVLVANTRFDPATPYEGAKEVAKLLPNARLVTVAGWGHTTFGTSVKLDDIIENYFLQGALPKKGTVLAQDAMPFGLPASSQVLEPMAEAGEVVEPSPVRRMTTEDAENSDKGRARKILLRGILRNRLFEK